MAASEVPPGQRHDPSSWSARLPLVALAAVGLVVATYLTVAQLGGIASAWDPVFGDGSDRVLHSAFSESLPVSDAGLGAAAYAVEVVLGLLGAPGRWRRSPWLALAFEAVVAGAAGGGLALVVVQAAVVHHYCSLCLLSTAVSVAILGLSRLREARAATGEVLRRRATGVGWRDAVLGEAAGRPVDLVRGARLQEARATVAALTHLAAGLVLVVVATGAYEQHGGTGTQLWRDVVVGAVLLVLGAAGSRAPLAVRRSPTVALLLGLLLIGCAAAADGTPDGRYAVALWTELACGLAVLLAAAVQLASGLRGRHLLAESHPQH
ncbi:putative membrane protein [Motilibacter rhizosphaerae]|uniref:Putative membrane protein n=1 Tax=Motilibacter rhizosphaerae TaxID=598652 RepID=A0A4Q7NPU2_9ACTN|nr:vitamin K epoxide reductase family protein [Motilibacter rhizosphaerae]RZS87311.1 putative membrane protein [Motilibacter rhizosphaerae]